MTTIASPEVPEFGPDVIKGDVTGASRVQSLLRTTNDGGTMLVRLILGLVMFPHGAQKMLGWFGGYGFNGTMAYFTQQLHIPAVFAFLAIMAEFAGSLGLIAGLLTRVAAFGILCNMIVATLTTHWANGFFMNWFGQQKGEGFEYHILAGALALYLIIKGGGRASVDGGFAANRP